MCHPAKPPVTVKENDVSTMVRVQQLTELEEVIEYTRSAAQPATLADQERRTLTREMWRGRLRGAMPMLSSTTSRNLIARKSEKSLADASSSCGLAGPAERARAGAAHARGPGDLAEVRQPLPEERAGQAEPADPPAAAALRPRGRRGARQARVRGRQRQPGRHVCLSQAPLGHRQESLRPQETAGG
eukprot:scaffold74567_cov44-Prasinocladus_malaysianus.AAC.1